MQISKKNGTLQRKMTYLEFICETVPNYAGVKKSNWNSLPEERSGQ